MVRMPGQNLLSPVYLLQKHDSRKQMRPSLFSKTQEMVSAFSDCRGQAVGAAYDELDRSGALVAVAAKKSREILRAQRLSALIQSDHGCAWGEAFEDFLLFFCLSERGVRVAGFYFVNCERPFDSFYIFRAHIGVGAFFQPCNGDDFDIKHRRGACRALGLGAVYQA